MGRLFDKELCGPTILQLADVGDGMDEFLHALNLVPCSRPRCAAQAGTWYSSKGRVGRPELLVADRADLPEALTFFDPLPFLCARSRVALEEPSRLLLPAEHITKKLPPGRLATKAELLKSAVRWHKLGNSMLRRTMKSTLRMRPMSFLFSNPGQHILFQALIDKLLIAEDVTSARGGLSQGPA